MDLGTWIPTTVLKIGIPSGLLLLAYLIGLAVYRLYFHPLAAYPGPKLAALSTWYEFYWDVILDGQFTVHTQELHKKYGPIIRLTPEEIHIDDPEYYDHLYSRAGRRDKYYPQTIRIGYTNDMFSTASHDLHRARRKSLNPFFSVQKIDEFQGVIREKIEKLCRKIAEYENGKVLPLDRAWMALTTDIITQYSFAKSYDHLDSPNFHGTFHESMVTIYKAINVALHYPIIFPILESLPEWLVEKVAPEVLPITGFKKGMIKQVVEVREGLKDSHKSFNHSTIFHELLLNDEIPPQEKTDRRLGDEAQVIVAAGLITTSWALSVASFHLANNPSLCQRLREELQTAQSTTSGALEWHKLEQLPLLHGCVREGMRLSCGVSTRTPRLAPDIELKYGDWSIPRNTPVSMSTYDILMKESIFPNPREFIPERWVDKDLERFFVPFGKGTRACLGMNLAQAEMYLSIAAVFSRFKFDLYETDISDVEMKHGLFVPFPKRSSRGVRILVKSVID